MKTPGRETRAQASGLAQSLQTCGPTWLWLLTFSLGCAAAPDCGPNTRLKDGKCVVASAGEACPAGTVKSGAECLVAGDAGSGDVVADQVTADSGAADSSADSGVDGAVSDLACVPVCAAKNACGPDGCGGSCGKCVDGHDCTHGICVEAAACLPHCAGLLCGEDGCGGVCGTCADPAKPVCTEGKCVAKCIPACVGKACGGDGCGGSCGTCGSGDACSTSGLCVPASWTCAAEKWDVNDQCDCGCGSADPDCANKNLATLGCSSAEICVNGACAAKVPKAWTCLADVHGDGILCDCGCGVADPDCAVPGAYVIGCKAGETCSQQSTCSACKADCTGKVCGSDGCGGTCGKCADPSPGQPQLACVGGKCIDGCAPEPVVCKTNLCGDDGCGGTCGKCLVGEFCNNGQCQPEPGKSCSGHCKGKAPGGCSCSVGCVEKGDCCSDYQGVCVCKPACAGKACGPDGCGGKCGSCKDITKPFCGPDATCNAQCTPVCATKTCGNDGCGGSCGTCAAGGTCAESGSYALCVPAAWNCPQFYYADGSTCDCSCGAPDPDCKKIAQTVGCPNSAACNKDTGLCQMSFCASDGDCKVPKWCVGHYPAGPALRKGVCQVPNPAAGAEFASCNTDLACASGVCGAGLCRRPCQQDSHCGPGGACIGYAVVQGLTLKPLGVVAACEVGAKLGPTCSSQTGCQKGQTCLAVIEASTLKAVLRCGVLPSAQSVGQSCAASSKCAVGLVCQKGKCQRACPAGVSDCPTGFTCSPGVLHGGASAAPDDDVTVPACTAK